MHAPSAQGAPDTTPLDERPAPQPAYPLMPGAEPFYYQAGEVGCVLVHGFTSTPFEMRGLGAYLAEQGISAYAPLLAGHGTSPEELQHTTWVDWYASVNDALDLMMARCRRVYLVGLSLGGALTLFTAAQRRHDPTLHPDPSAVATKGQALAGIVAMSSPIYLPPGLGSALRGLIPGVPYVEKFFRDIEDPEARAAHVGYTRSSVAAMASLIEFLEPVRKALPRVKVPTLVIYARHDHVVPCVSSHYIYSRVGTADKRMLALHRGFHIVTVDTDREKVFEGVHSFISEREKGSKT
jgi:carboxylesterase